MSARPDFESLESPALDADRDPPNLHRYASEPAADDRDAELRARVRHEQQDERARRREPRDTYLAREYGVRRWGEL